MKSKKQKIFISERFLLLGRRKENPLCQRDSIKWNRFFFLNVQWKFHNHGTFETRPVILQVLPHLERDPPPPSLLSWWVGCVHLWGGATKNADSVVMTNLKTSGVPAAWKAQNERVRTHLAYVLLCSDRGLCVINTICHHPVHLDGPAWANCLPHKLLLRQDYKGAKHPSNSVNIVKHPHMWQMQTRTQTWIVRSPWHYKARWQPLFHFTYGLLILLWGLLVNTESKGRGLTWDLETLSTL